MNPALCDELRVLPIRRADTNFPNRDIYVSLQVADFYFRSLLSQISYPSLWNQKAHCHVHRSPTRGSVLRQISLTHTLSTFLVKTHLIPILASTISSSKRPLSLRFYYKNFVSRTHLSLHVTINFSTCKVSRKRC